MQISDREDVVNLHMGIAEGQWSARRHPVLVERFGFGQLLLPEPERHGTWHQPVLPVASTVRIITPRSAVRKRSHPDSTSTAAFSRQTTASAGRSLRSSSRTSRSLVVRSDRSSARRQRRSLADRRISATAITWPITSPSAPRSRTPTSFQHPGVYMAPDTPAHAFQGRPAEFRQFAEHQPERHRHHEDPVHVRVEPVGVSTRLRLHVLLGLDAERPDVRRFRRRTCRRRSRPSISSSPTPRALR